MKWSIPEKTIERGRQYLKEGRVLSVEADQEARVWHAEVLGTEPYMVELDGTAKEKDYCECPYWQEHGYCKHTVAVELYLKEQGTSRIITAATGFAKLTPGTMFTKGFARLLEKPKRGRKLVVEYHVEPHLFNPYHPEDSLLLISLKIGYQQTKRNYIVKNIGEFLQTFLTEGEFTTNRLVFQLAREAFAPQDQQLLAQLATIQANNQLLNVDPIMIKGKQERRYLQLPLAGQPLLQELADTGRLFFTTETETLQQLTFEPGLPPVEFHLVTTVNGAELRILDQHTLFLAPYHWLFFHGQIYQLSVRQEAIYRTLQQLLKRMKEPIVHYETSELSAVFTDVLPALREIGHVQVESAIQAQVLSVPLEVQYVLKKQQGKIRLRVDFHYEPAVFSTDPAHEVAVQQEVLRDRSGETAALQILPQLGFTKTATGYEKALPKEAALYQFFTQELPLLRRYGQVKMGKKLRELFLDAQQYRPEVAVNDEGSWLSVRFDISGIEAEEVDAALRALLRKEAFYTTKSGAILTFDSEEFQETSQALQQLRGGVVKDGAIQVPRNQGLYVQETLGGRATFSDSFEKMVTDLNAPEQFPAVLPEGLQATLRSYQVTGYRWLKMLSHYQFGGILADEMGLGKTLQTIAYLLSEKTAATPALIVAPASLTYNWQAEFRKFAPSLTTVVVNGTKEERQQLLAQSANVWITSYASLRQDIEAYQGRTFGYLILDEAQMVKNSATKTAQALRTLAIPHRFALSGTPIENNLEELWSLFQLVLPGLFPPKNQFRELTPATVATMIQPFVLRREKKDVLKDLPEKIESNLYSALTEEQKTVYLAYLRQMQAEVAGMDQQTFRKNRMNILAGLTRLRQICDDPRLFLPDYAGSSGKLEQVLDLLETAKENGRRVLLFSQFTGMLSILEAELAKRSLTTFYLRGSTKPQDRIQMVDAFNAGEKDVFLISMKAGGTGLNLTGADTVILYDLWWNPAVEEQAAGRAHRIGQKKVVEVWRMIAEGTIEERMDALQQEKRELFQRVIQGNEEQLQRLTEEDIRMILSMGS